MCKPESTLFYIVFQTEYMYLYKRTHIHLKSILQTCLDQSASSIECSRHILEWTSLQQQFGWRPMTRYRRIQPLRQPGQHWHTWWRVSCWRVGSDCTSSTRLSRKLKLLILSFDVLAVLLFGSKTWNNLCRVTLRPFQGHNLKLKMTQIVFSQFIDHQHHLLTTNQPSLMNGLI